jgi:bacterioferritin-associated ferredoxin
VKKGKIIVCRCEDVTARDVEDAVARGYADLESIKRFTGLATGWCQGKHCLPLCARVLARAGGEMAERPITPRPPFHPVPLAHLALLVDDVARNTRAGVDSDGPEVEGGRGR